MPTNQILQYLKKHGERLDTEIAEATGIKLAAVRIQLSELAAKGEVMTCQSILFVKGKKIERLVCRIAGYIPSVSPGRKSKAQVNVNRG
ncbi:MAG: ArsR family transcriptional regulator [Gallionella sp.]|nr:ArsR family transcriptional regulator [Gallionella sp.]